MKYGPDYPLCLNRQVLVNPLHFDIKLAAKAGIVITPVEIKTNINNQVKTITPTDRPNKILAYTQMIVDKYQAADNPGYTDLKAT